MSSVLVGSGSALQSTVPVPPELPLPLVPLLEPAVPLELLVPAVLVPVPVPALELVLEPAVLVPGFALDPLLPLWVVFAVEVPPGVELEPADAVELPVVVRFGVEVAAGSAAHPVMAQTNTSNASLLRMENPLVPIRSCPFSTVKQWGTRPHIGSRPSVRLGFFPR